LKNNFISDASREEVYSGLQGILVFFAKRKDGRFQMMHTQRVKKIEDIKPISKTP
jgi:hypothetical protein